MDEDGEATVVDGMIHRRLEEHGLFAPLETFHGEICHPAVHIGHIGAGQWAGVLIGAIGVDAGDGGWVIVRHRRHHLVSIQVDGAMCRAE